MEKVGCNVPCPCESVEKYEQCCLPGDAQALNDRGVVLESQGNLHEAALSFEAAITLRPDYVDAHYGLSSLKTYGEDDPHPAMLESQLDKVAAYPLEARIKYWFALGKMYEDLSRYDASFSAYQEGNRLRFATLDPNEEGKDALAARIMSVFTKEFFAKHIGISPKTEKTPIFIVGMPRSGTSLLEQILASCESVYGAGELSDMQELVATVAPNLPFASFPDALSGLSTEDFKNLGEQYIERLWRHAPAGMDPQRITDKMPANFFYIGMIRLMLPQAKIIHAMRDPMDSCFSCYSRLFAEDSVNFSYDLGTLGQYTARHVKLMQHWRTVLPADVILDVRYEDMVADTEGEARRLLDFLGMPWDERCLAFHQNKRRVSTASSAQVRKPIYQSSLARWERFAGHLAPLWQRVKDCRERCAPPHAQALHQLSIGFHRMGDDTQAIELITQALAAAPSNSEIHNDLGGLLSKQGKASEAIASFRKALALDPANARAHYNLGCVLQEQDRQAEAEICYSESLAIDPDAIDVLGNLGACLLSQGKQAEAEACYRHALTIQPNAADIHNNLGFVLSDQGRLEEAALSFETALSLKPDFIDPHYGLSKIKTYREDDPHVALLEQQIGRLEGLSITTRISYWFALGKMREDIGRYDQSFAAYREGNNLKCTLLTEHDAAEEAWLQRIMAIFTKDFFATRNSAAKSNIPVDKTPIFIVGMPRSGTSLLEQILASYPDICGAGELGDLREVLTAAMPNAAFEQFPDAIPDLSVKDFLKMGEQYTERLWRHAPAGLAPKRITDKMPANFFYVGMIHLMLPNAKIIHAMRDPMDSCFSCYSHLFDQDNVSFTYDQQALGRYHARYAKLMRHWHAVLPAGTVLDVRYEDMVANTEAQARRLLSYLNLPWDERCLAFHQNKRRVITASFAQVRKPIYRTSLARWQRFAGHLGTLWNLVKDDRDLPLPQDAQTLHKLGIAVHQTGDNQQAITLIEQAIVKDPSNSEAMNDLGGLYSLQEQADRAIDYFRQSLALNPSNARTHYNLGCTLQAQGNLDEAETSYRQALSFAPDAIDMLCNLGSCLQEQRKADEAITCFRQVLAKNPNDINSLNNLGVSLQTNGKVEEAITCFTKTIVQQPDFVRGYINLGMTFYDLGDYEKSLAYYMQALAIAPNVANSNYCVGIALQALCKPEEALRFYQHSLALSDNPKVYDNLLMVQLFLPEATQQELFDAHHAFGTRYEATLKSRQFPHKNNRDANKRLKIGYVSGDFRNHAVAYFIDPVFANHDKSQVEVFCYSNSSRNDSFTERLIAEVDHWQPCLGMSDEQLAQRIRADGIDILIDLAGHTAYNRLLVFARKPAPIQITYLGYPNTTGLSVMDYRLTDRYTEPEGGGADRYYTETLLRLPDSIWCYRPADNMQEITPLPALANGFITFGSFNNANKIDTDSIALWAALLRSLPRSRLLMATVPAGGMRERLTRQFSEHGIATERLSFCGKLPSHEFQRMLQQVDITLDPIHVNGATTTCESLWLGVPVLTLVGERFLERAGLSVLSAAGLPDFAATTSEALIKTATLLANNLPLLANIRAGLREHLRNTPLLDQQRFTRNLEGIYRDVWRRWCEP